MRLVNSDSQVDKNVGVRLAVDTGIQTELRQETLLVIETHSWPLDQRLSGKVRFLWSWVKPVVKRRERKQPTAPGILVETSKSCGQLLLLDIVQNLDKKVAMSNDPSSLLRENGVHVTAQRLAVMRVVTANPHCTADEIAEAVRQEIGTISRQAVYDAVKVLVEKGIIRRIQPAGSPALFEDRVGDNHHHVICRKCGKTADVDCAVGEKPCLQAQDCGGYRIDEAEVIYWGVCPTCLAAQTN